MACTGMCRCEGDGFWPLFPKQGIACPKQGNKIEGVVLNRVCILGFFCPKQGVMSQLLQGLL